MKKLHNLSIRKKFAVVIIPLVATLLCFDFFQIRHDYLDYQDAGRLNKAINVSLQVTHLLHELQRERSASVLYMIKNDAASAEALNMERARTDSVLQLYHLELEDSQFDDIIKLHADDIAQFNQFERKVSELRDMINKSFLEPKNVIKYYSDINYTGYDLINILISESRNNYASKQVHAIIYFLEMKEFASIERDLGTLIFTTHQDEPHINEEFAGLLASQNAYKDSFLKIADAKANQFYDRTMQGQDIEELEKMRALLFNGQDLSIDPNFWQDVVSRKLNSLKEVEEFLLSEMHNYTENMAARAWETFWTFLMIDMLVAGFTLALMFIVITKLILNVSTLEAFTIQVSKGDLSHKVVIDTKDEIGHYANTFNMMVNEINKTQQELKKERDHAEYMYENIYKQSEVVFENVGQGIFLLDKDFRISNLYSKAVEQIFDNESIANENFCNFMRPRIIQRDYEALEMFVKHLFNPELDEDVVNQLNPIEQVKIFISTNGVVITKHLRVSFTRVERNNEIQSILVTISDETESVLLQQHMEESESKKKKETEYMLNIFKVDPTILREFLVSARKSLKGISERYEKSAKSDLNELLKYTFQIVHNVKGNAMSIGLDLISEKLHEIEESIMALRDRNVKADKFLALLYELEEVDKMTTDMTKMLDKVGEIYGNFHANASTDPKVRLEEALKSGLKAMSKGSNKKAELVFNNPMNVVLPEAYVAPLKDVFIQMMRNSLSHGIEEPALRIAKGKSEKGLISVTINGSGDHEFIVSYSDDGNGLDLDKIREKAVAAGIGSKAAVAKMKDEAVVNLLFENGFTTSDKVDSFSGRGQGLSLISTIIEEQRGSFEVRYEKDKFFEIIFRLPAVSEQKIENVA